MKFFFKVPEDYEPLAEITIGLTENLVSIINHYLTCFYLLFTIFFIAVVYKLILFFYHLFF